MKRALTALGIVIAAAGCADDGSVLGPSTSDDVRPAASNGSAARQVDASGQFLAQVDFTSFTFTPRGRNCLLTVNGQLVFTGTIDGTATGTTSALVFAPCADVMAAPPGTYPDVFRSELEFRGTIDGEPATANLLYMGRVAEGGTIDGRLIFSNGVAGRLEADAIVAVGGTYHGRVVVP